jgi:hypothetical protein
MATVVMERVVSHNRLLEICDAHSHDLSLLLARLVRLGLLETDGRSRGMVYFLPGDSLPTPDQVFVGPTFIRTKATNMGSSSEYSPTSSEYSTAGSEYSENSDEKRDVYGRLLTRHLDAPVVDGLLGLDKDFLAELERLAEEPRQKEKLSSERMMAVLQSLCANQYLTLSVLAELVCRNPDGLRQQYLSKMVKSGEMRLAFPTKPTHEKQAYRAAMNIAGDQIAPD